MRRPGTWCRLKIHYCLHLLPAQTKCRLLVGWFFWGIVVQERNDEIVAVKYASLLQCFDTVGNRVSSADLCVLFFYGLLFFFFCEELSCCIQPNCAFVIYKSFVRNRKMGKTVKTKKPNNYGSPNMSFQYCVLSNTEYWVTYTSLQGSERCVYSVRKCFQQLYFCSH